MKPRWTIYISTYSKYKHFLIEELDKNKLDIIFEKTILMSPISFGRLTDVGAINVFKHKSAWDYYSKNSFRYMIQGLGLPLTFDLEALKTHPLVLVLMKKDFEYLFK